MLLLWHKNRFSFLPLIIFTTCQRTCRTTFTYLSFVQFRFFTVNLKGALCGLCVNKQVSSDLSVYIQCFSKLELNENVESNGLIAYTSLSQGFKIHKWKYSS